MTQLMLFDTPVQSNISADSAQQPRKISTRSSRSSSTRVSPAEAEVSEDGVQRMGNLAHLVLARYDMVARRREAQRRARAAAAS